MVSIVNTWVGCGIKRLTCIAFFLSINYRRRGFTFNVLMKQRKMRNLIKEIGRRGGAKRMSPRIRHLGKASTSHTPRQRHRGAQEPQTTWAVLLHVPGLLAPAQTCLVSSHISPLFPAGLTRVALPEQ